jgi:acyl transferase domain-containing protein
VQSTQSFNNKTMNNISRISSSSVILVSGGARGITADCSIQLVKKYRCKLILVGRSRLLESEPEWAKNCDEELELKKRILASFVSQGEKPTPAKVQSIFKSIFNSREIKKTLAKIEELGGKAEYIGVDLTNLSALKEAIVPVVSKIGKITGIIHGAGALADKLIENKSERDFETVYSTKIEGLENLLNCVSMNQLDFLVLFSSFVAFFGNPGQADYSLANEILNKIAYLLQEKYSACHVVSIGWGPWDGGMVSPQLKKLFESKNINLIPVEVGSQMLVDELSNNGAKVSQIIIMSQPIVAENKQLTLHDRTFRIQRVLSLESNPFVLDHVIAHRPVLPAMCALSWLINSCEQLYPGYQFFSCENYKVLKGIVFDESLAKVYTLDLHKIENSTDEGFNLEAIIWSESTKKIPHYHYQTKITILPKLPKIDPYYLAIDRSLNFTKAICPYRDGTLFHLGHFQGIKKVISLSDRGLVAQCSVKQIPDKKQGQFFIQSFNPYTADLLFQCLLVWVRYFYQLGSLPVKVEKIEHFQLLPFDREFLVNLDIQSSNETKVIANATACDRYGQVYLKIHQMQVTPSASLNQLFRQNTIQV